MRPSRALPPFLLALVAAVVLTGCGGLLAAGSNLSCVIGYDGAAWCFGDNADGQAGHSAGSATASPGKVALPKRVVAGTIAIGKGDPDGDAAACAVTGRRNTTEGFVRCWGDDDNGQLGRGSAGAPSATPVLVRLPGGASASTVSVGAFSACALASGSGEGVICWGSNGEGQLGVPTPGIAGPTLVPGTATYTDRAGAAVAPSLLAVGTIHACAGISEALSCWGAGAEGELGNGADANSATPVAVRLPADVSVNAISAGIGFTCAVTTVSGGSSNAGAHCWGFGTSGQLGNGATASSNVPVRVAVPGSLSVSQISAGGNHACFVDTNSSVWCWGGNEDGQLGDGTTTERSAPTLVEGVKASLVAAGVGHTCASRTDGRMVCWGSNGRGQLGTAAGADSFTPKIVPRIQGLRAPVAAGRKVRVRGNARVGGRLTATTTKWRWATGYDYRWERRTRSGWQAIDGQTAKTLRVTNALRGARVRVVVSGRNTWSEALVVTAQQRPSPAVTIAR